MAAPKRARFLAGHGREARQGPRYLKLIELHGLVYSEEEANDFKESAPRADTQQSLGALPQSLRDELRDYAEARLLALGWPSKKAA